MITNAFISYFQEHHNWNNYTTVLTLVYPLSSSHLALQVYNAFLTLWCLLKDSQTQSKFYCQATQLFLLIHWEWCKQKHLNQASTIILWLIHADARSIMLMSANILFYAWVHCVNFLRQSNTFCYQSILKTSQADKIYKFGIKFIDIRTRSDEQAWFKVYVRSKLF